MRSCSLIIISKQNWKINFLLYIPFNMVSFQASSLLQTSRVYRYANHSYNEAADVKNGQYKFYLSPGKCNPYLPDTINSYRPTKNHNESVAIATKQFQETSDNVQFNVKISNIRGKGEKFSAQLRKKLGASGCWVGTRIGAGVAATPV